MEEACLANGTLKAQEPLTSGLAHHQRVVLGSSLLQECGHTSRTCPRLRQLPLVQVLQLMQLRCELCIKASVC
eukprot:3604203-Amphidinium_carterae.2